MRSDLIAQHPFIDSVRSSAFTYFTFPKSMLCGIGREIGLTPDLCLLYAVLKDQSNLSAKNHLTDEEGKVYFYFKIDNIIKATHWKKSKVLQEMKNLQECGLLESVAQFDKSGMKSANKYYLKLWMEPNYSFRLDDILNRRFPYITEELLTTANTGSYFTIPKILFSDERYEGLKPDRLIVYCMILDRLAESEKYGRVDANGLVWCVYKEEELAETMNYAIRTIQNIYADLQNANLIVRVSGGCRSKARRVYARDYIPAPADPNAVPPAELPDDWESKLSDAENGPLLPGKNVTRKKQTTDTQISDHGTRKKQTTETQKTDCNNNPLLINPLLNDPLNKQASPARLSPQPQMTGCLPEERKDYYLGLNARMQADSLLHAEEVEDMLETHMIGPDREAAKDWLCRCIDTIAEDLNLPGKYAVVAGAPVLKDELLTRYKKITPEIMYVTLQKLVLILPDDIRDIRAYLRSTLYHAWEQHNAEAYLLHQRGEI